MGIVLGGTEFNHSWVRNSHGVRCACVSKAGCFPLNRRSWISHGCFCFWRDFEMSGWLMGVVTVLYSGVCLDQAWKGDAGMSLAFAGYALANIGLIMRLS
jgi:hypothetical protein